MIVSNDSSMGTVFNYRKKKHMSVLLTLLAISFLAAHTIHHWLPAHNEDPFEVSTVFTHTYLRKSNSWLKFVTQLCKSPH